MSRTREQIFEIDLSKPAREPTWEPLKNLRLLALGTKVEPPGATFGPRHQYSWLLVWVRQGTVRFAVDGTVYDGEPGSVFLVPPLAVDTHDWSDRERTVHSFIHFDFQPPARGWPLASRWPVLRTFPESHPVLILFDYVVSLPQKAHRGWTKIILPMIELILRLHVALDVASHSPKSPAVPDLTARALGLIHHHVEERASEPILLATLASQLHVSAAHLCRSFKRSLGIGPMKCVQLMRLDKAVRLLERTDLFVKEVASRTGFGNAYHLSAAFSKTFGISPTRYREARAKGLQPRNFSPALRQLPEQRILIDAPAMRTHMTKLRRTKKWSPPSIKG